MKSILLYKELSLNGIKFYNPISKIRKYLGVTFIIIAIIPNGLFIPSILLSCLCFGFKVNYMKDKLFNTSLLLKSKLGVLQ